MGENIRKISGWVLLSIVVLTFFTTGCIAHAGLPGTTGYRDETQNNTPLPDIYTAPIGGFNEKTISMDRPNITYTTTYTLYTRNWTGGNVSCFLYDEDTGREFVSTDQLQITIDPSRFTAGPNLDYTTNLTLTTGPNYQKCYDLVFVVELEGNPRHYANDTLWIRPDDAPGLGIMSIEKLETENQSLAIKKGEERKVNVTFKHGFTGLEIVKYHISDAPLNVSVVPDSFIASHGAYRYPANLMIYADPTISPGQYNFTLSANRTESIFFTGWGRDNDGVWEISHGYSSLIPDQLNFTVNVMDA